MPSFPDRPPTPETGTFRKVPLWSRVLPVARRLAGCWRRFLPLVLSEAPPPVDPAPDLPLPPAPIVWGLLPEAPGWLCLLWCALLFCLLGFGREKIGVGCWVFFFFFLLCYCFSDFVIWVVFLILGRWIDTGCRGLVLQFFFNNEKALGCRMKNKASENKCSS